jgi:hypothetical protein
MLIIFNLDHVLYDVASVFGRQDHLPSIRLNGTGVLDTVTLEKYVHSFW